MRHRLLRSLSAAVLAMLASGCGDVQPSEVPGSYVRTMKNGREGLVLSADGQFEHWVDRAGSCKTLDRGRWQFERMEGEPYLLLKPFTPTEGLIRASMSSYVSLDRTLVGIDIVANDDFGYSFSKRK